MRLDLPRTLICVRKRPDSKPVRVHMINGQCRARTTPELGSHCPSGPL